MNYLKNKFAAVSLSLGVIGGSAYFLPGYLQDNTLATNALEEAGLNTIALEKATLFSTIAGCSSQRNVVSGIPFTGKNKEGNSVDGTVCQGRFGDMSIHY